MKIMPAVIALALLAACKKPEAVKSVESAVQEVRAGDTQPARYVEGLQRDVKKADQVADKASASIEKTNQAVEDVLKESGQ